MGQSCTQVNVGVPDDLREEITLILRTRRTLALVTALAVLALSAMTAIPGVHCDKTAQSDSRPQGTQIATVAAVSHTR